MTASDPTGSDPGSARESQTDALPGGRPPAEPVATFGPDVLRRQHLFGLDLVDDVDLGLVLETVLGHHGEGDGHVGGEAPANGSDRASDGDLPVLVTPNVDIIVHLSEHPDSPEAEVCRRARYVLPDGMPLVAASRLLRRPLSGRLTGSGLFELLWPRLLSEKRRLVVLCASTEIVQRLDPDTERVSFVVPPWFDHRADDELDAVADEVLAATGQVGAEYVLLGLGNPKDAVIAGRVLERWPAGRGEPPLVLGLGGSFAMYAGLQKRAPRWIQRIGMEWFYRFAQEPRRLFHRYFVRDMAFFRIVAVEAWRLRASLLWRREKEHS